MAANKMPVDLTNQGHIESSLTLFQGWLREMSTGTTGPQKFGDPNDPMTLQLTKFLGKTVEIIITGPYKKTFTLEGELPCNDGNKLDFEVSWSDNEVRLLLFGQLVDTKPVDQGK